MTLRTETRIRENWMCHETPLVSIVCITYNHESYIADAIESFVMQQTHFPFEIIIQDDASTDKTAVIIGNYAKKFPNIIKPVFHKKNQFSQLGKNVLLMAVSHAKGNYIACCEGDDYWIDKNKLQTQITEMQKHPECSISFHPVFLEYANKKKRQKIISQHSQRNTIFNTSQLILGTAKFCQMTSIVFRASVFKSVPDWFLDAPVGDYFLQILSSLNGGALYVNEVMATYRVNAIGSWSEKMSKDENFICTYFTGMLKSLNDIDIYTDKKFSRDFDIIKKKICFFMCINPALSSIKRKEIFEKNKHKISFFKKMLWHLLFKNQRLSHFLFNIRNYILN